MIDQPMRRAANVVVAEVDGRPMLLNLGSWTHLSFNETGALIWDHLETPQSRGTLLRLLREEFDAADADLAADLDRFLDDLQRQGFVEAA